MTVLRALNEGDLITALKHYHGPFLLGHDESPWVLQMRDKFRLSLQHLLLEHVRRLSASGHLEEAVGFLTTYLEAEPDDLEMQDERLRLARHLGVPSVLAQCKAAYQAALAS